MHPEKFEKYHYYDDKINSVVRCNMCMTKGCRAYTKDLDHLFCDLHSKFVWEDKPRLDLNLKDSYYVYFVMATGTGRIKIGKTNHVEERMAALQTGSPIELELTYALELDGRYETIFHRFFDQERLHGEWFFVSDTMKEFFKLIDEDGVKGVKAFIKKFYGDE